MSFFWALRTADFFYRLPTADYGLPLRTSDCGLESRFIRQLLERPPEDAQDDRARGEQQEERAEEGEPRARISAA